jgi:NAD-dependent dihydropyrimidine dehydrogenase PreA subunit
MQIFNVKYLPIPKIGVCFRKLFKGKGITCPMVIIMPEWKSEELGITITVDYDKCTGVGDCVDMCPVEVFEVQNEKAVVVNIDECTECCACVTACPNEAIEHSSC